jgi:predicted Ser/Thr protein kinase
MSRSSVASFVPNAPLLTVCFMYDFNPKSPITLGLFQKSKQNYFVSSQKDGTKIFLCKECALERGARRRSKSKEQSAPSANSANSATSPPPVSSSSTKREQQQQQQQQQQQHDHHDDTPDNQDDTDGADDAATYVALPLNSRTANAVHADHREKAASAHGKKSDKSKSKSSKSHKKSHKSGKKSGKKSSKHKKKDDSGSSSADGAGGGADGDLYTNLPVQMRGSQAVSLQTATRTSTSSQAVYTTLQPEDDEPRSGSLKYVELAPELQPSESSSRARVRPPPPTDDYVADDPNARPTKPRKSSNAGAPAATDDDDGGDDDDVVPHVSQTVSAAMYQAHYASRKSNGVGDEFAELHKIPFSSVDINFDDKLGNGEYGVVYSGTWNGLKVAVKELTGGARASEQARTQFMREVKLMQEIGEHPFVLRSFGCTRNDQSSYLLLEFAAHGSLHRVLRADNVDLDRATIIRMAYEISSGMAYLHDTAKIIHRDLACRNVLVTDDGHMKIADFGLSRAVVGTMQTDRGRKFPIKWLAPETLREGVFSQKTDVWSFGILVWEIWNGCEPFANLSTKEVVRRAITEPDFQPNVAPSIPAVLRRLLNECFDHDPQRQTGVCRHCAATQGGDGQ